MPCRDYWPEDEQSRVHDRQTKDYQARIDKLTQDLCFLCGTLEGNNLTGHLNYRISEWWEKHKASDERRIKREMKKAVNKKSSRLRNASALAEHFIKKAEKVHPVSSFHKTWFQNLAEEAVREFMEKKVAEKAENKLKEKAKKKIREALSPEELAILKDLNLEV